MGRGMDGMQMLECTLRLMRRRAERTIALYSAPGTRGGAGWSEWVGSGARGMSKGKCLYERGVVWSAMSQCTRCWTMKGNVEVNYARRVFC